MVHQIEQLVRDHDGAIRASIDHEVKARVAAFGFEQEVQNQVTRVVHDFVRRRIEDAMRVVMEREKQRIDAAVRRAVEETLRS